MAAGEPTMPTMPVEASITPERDLRPRHLGPTAPGDGSSRLCILQRAGGGGIQQESMGMPMMDPLCRLFFGVAHSSPRAVKMCHLVRRRTSAEDDQNIESGRILGLDLPCSDDACELYSYVAALISSTC